MNCNEAIAKQIRRLWPKFAKEEVARLYKEEMPDKSPTVEDLANFIIETGGGSKYVDDCDLKEKFLYEYFDPDDYLCRLALNFALEDSDGIIFEDWDYLADKVDLILSSFPSDE